MTESDKFRVVNTLKQLMINHQYYEISAYLRDLEKTTYKDFTLNKRMFNISDFSPSDYHFSIQLISDWRDSRSLLSQTTNKIDVRKDYDKIRCLLDSKLLHLIRQIKIDGILD